MTALLIGLAAWVLLSLPAGVGVGIALRRLAATTTTVPAAQVKGSTARRRGSHLRAV